MIRDLKPYPAYRDSGVEWLGEVPEHWQVARLKTHLVRNDPGAWGTDFADDGTIVLRSTEQTIEGGWRVKNPARRQLSQVEKETTRLHAGDLVVTKSSGSPAHIGKTSLVTAQIEGMECGFSNFMQRLRPDSKTAPRFMWAFLNNRAGRDQLVYYSTTTTGLGNLNGAILGSLWVAFPPLPEQSAIVRLLDHVDRRIRRRIRAKQRLIALLNEQKQAIIHRAVTRGLDPDVRLKPSGVEWLGDVPEHWEVVRSSRLVMLTTGFPFTSEGFSHDEGDIRLLRGINIAPGRIRWEAAVRWPTSQARDFVEYALREGDIVLGMDRPIVRGGVRVAVIGRADVPSLVLQRVARIRTRSGLDASFAFLLLGGKSFADYLAPIFTGISVPHISPEQIGSFRIALPPPSEQRRIVNWVQANTLTLKALAESARSELDLLREYRTRLIADVVTGKLDVREAAAHLPEETDEPEPLDDTDTSPEDISEETEAPDPDALEQAAE